MSLEFVRKYYNVPAKRGGRVSLKNAYGVRLGTITKATHYIFVKFDDATFSVPVHPLDDGLTYLKVES